MGQDNENEGGRALLCDDDEDVVTATEHNGTGRGETMLKLTPPHLILSHQFQSELSELSELSDW